MDGTLGVRSGRLARALIRGASAGRFAGRTAPQSSSGTDTLDASRFQHTAGRDLFAILGRDPRDIAGRRLLDIVGFGGHTVYYAEMGAQVVGLEPYNRCVEVAHRFAGSRDVPAEFVVGWGEQLPFPDASFDLAVAFDVLEHVDDPAAVLAEVTRVVRAGGEAWLIFPSYLGARASHLDFVSRTPGLHRLFDPATLAAAANAEAERQGLLERVRPALGAFGRVTVTDSLNGMSAREAERLLTGLPFDWTLRREPLIEPRSRLPARLAGFRRARTTWRQAAGTACSAA